MESTGKVTITKEFLDCEDLEKTRRDEINEEIEKCKEELDRVKPDMAGNLSPDFIIRLQIVSPEINFFCEIKGE